MNSKFKKIINSIKTSVWFHPILFGSLSLIGALLIIMIDTRVLPQFQSYIPTIFLTSTDLAKDVLGIIASAFITITTFTFSTVMVVLTLYTSQFSPRVIENFLTNKNTTRTFGIFLGGFIYSIVSLLFMRSNISDYLVISASIGVIYIIGGLFYFSTFIHNVGTFIQPSNLIDRLYGESLSQINDYKAFIQEKPIIKKQVNNYTTFEKHYKKILSVDNGYIQDINYKRLSSIANQTNTVIALEKVTGQFLTDKTHLFTAYFDKNSELSEDIDKKILDTVVIGDRKTENQDFSFIIQKISEMSVRALSPGINDPNTAIHCIRIIGVSLRHLSGLTNGYVVIKKDKDASASVLFEAFDFDKLLRDAFGQIIHYGKGDYTVDLNILKALRHIVEKATKDNQQAIFDFSDYVWGKIEKQNFEALEMKVLKHELDEIYVYKSKEA